MNRSTFAELTETYFDKHLEQIKAVYPKVRELVLEQEEKSGKPGADKRRKVVDDVVEWLDAAVVLKGRWRWLDEWDQLLIRVIVLACVEIAVQTETRHRRPERDLAPIPVEPPLEPSSPDTDPAV